MTCTISPSIHTFSRHSYVSLNRNHYKHLSVWTEHEVKLLDKDLQHQTPTFLPHTPRDENRTNNLSLKLISDKYIARSPPRRSMVKAEDAHKRKTSTPRSAGQAHSPQNIAQNTTPSPSFRRAGTSVDHRQDHGQPQPARSSTLPVRQSPLTSAYDSDSTSSYSGSDRRSASSSRATTPDDNDEVETRESIIARKKREFVDSSMELFTREWYKWFATVLGAVECAGGGKRKRSTEQSSDRVSKSGQNPAGGGGSQKRQLDEGDRGSGGAARGNGDDEDDKGGGDRGGIGKKRAKRDSDKDLMFACPFLKHDQAKYGTRRTCCGPGWHDVHRLKEHLYRSHKAPKFVCHRCNQTFRTDDQYKVHQRASVPCPLQEPVLHDGFDQETENKLRARQTSSKNGKLLTEKQKWEEIYAILFPDDVVPSPYFDKTDSTNYDNGRQQATAEDVARFEQYFRRELLPQVRHDLEREVDAQFDGVGERFKTTMAEILQNAALKMRLKLMPTWAPAGCHGQSSSSTTRSPTPDHSALVSTSGPAATSALSPAHQSAAGGPAPDMDFAELDLANIDFSFDLSGMEFVDQILDFPAIDSGFGTQQEYSVANYA